MLGQSQIDREQREDEHEGQRRRENDRIDSRQRLRAKPGTGAGLLGGGGALAAFVTAIGGDVKRDRSRASARADLDRDAFAIRHGHITGWHQRLEQ